jgi:putative ATPase
MDLFSYQQTQTATDDCSLTARPLADLLRPKTLADVLGQESLLHGETAPLRQLANSGQLRSLILWGPPGVGKTTLARLLSQKSGYFWVSLSAVTAGVKEIRACVEDATQRLAYQQQRTVLFLDEIHRFSKSQQDALLPHVEAGTFVLLGATTENPYFSVNKALLSRVLLFKLEALSTENLRQLVKKSLHTLNAANQGTCLLQKDALEFLVQYANGDARALLTLLEAGFWVAPRVEKSEKGTEILLTLEVFQTLAQHQTRLSYDKGADDHFDHASAFQKSLRGSDADAALYWFAKMIAGGEDPRFIARRLLVCSAEDVGLADPQAFVLASHALQAVEQLGMPEARIPLAMVTAYVAKAPKSNAAYMALDEALADVTTGGKAFPVPLHLRSGHCSGAKTLGHGAGYVYSHDAPDVPQTFLPEALVGKKYLKPPIN